MRKEEERKRDGKKKVNMITWLSEASCFACKINWHHSLLPPVPVLAHALLPPGD